MPTDMSVREGPARSRGPADWLALAASPVFAAMAGLTEGLGGGPLDVLCAGSFGGLPLSAMSLMYLLMALFHLPPWLRLAGGREGGREAGQRTGPG